MRRAGFLFESLSNSSATSTTNGSCRVSSDCVVNDAGKQSVEFCLRLNLGDSRNTSQGSQRPKNIRGVRAEKNDVDLLSRPWV